MVNYIKRVVSFFVVMLFIATVAKSQTAGLNFQGVARNPSGVVFASQKISLKFSIIAATPNGTADYVETRVVNTNGQGVFSIVIGDTGAVSTLGIFANINWKQFPKYLKVEMDPNAGTSFATMGTTQLQTVPYANYSNYAETTDAGNLAGTTLKSSVTGSSLTSVGTLVNLTVTNPIVGSITGNAASATSATTATSAGSASTATKLATARNINGVAFDGSGDITITSTADAGALTGTTLKSTVTGSSLTSVGTLANLTVTNPIVGSITGNAVTATIAGNITATSNTTLTSLSNLAIVGTITTGVWSGTTITVAKGGTGLTSPGTSGNVLTSNGTSWVSSTPSSGVDLTTAQIVGGSKSFTNNMRVGTSTATSSAAFEVSSTTQGFLPPRMTMAQRDAIASPATGLMIFCTDCSPKGDPEFYNGIRWTSMNVAPLANTTIGDQVWSSTNLNVSRYRNGDVIPQVTDPTVWSSLTTGAWCWYNNDSVTYAATYGKLYNWYAVNDPRGLAPLGWHIPTDAEWTILTNYLGGTNVAGGFMKQTGTTLWTSPNTSATNTSSFTGLPGGNHSYDGTFYYVGNYGFWWSASELSTTSAFGRYLYSYSAIVTSYYGSKSSGYSVRCVRD